MTSTLSFLPRRNPLHTTSVIALIACFVTTGQVMASPGASTENRLKNEIEAQSPAETNAGSEIPVETSAGTGGQLLGKVQLKRRRRSLADSSNIVVYLEDVPGDAPTPPLAAHEIHQYNKHFAPKVSAVVVGTTIAFPNDDRIFHNVFSMSRAMKFDLGLYKSGTSKSVVASREGIVDIYCNIHPSMVAKVLVLPNTYFAITDKEGSFAIDGIPPGTYTLVAWQASGEPYHDEVTIRADAITHLDIEMKVGRRRAEAHTRKDGTPYGRYR